MEEALPQEPYGNAGYVFDYSRRPTSAIEPIFEDRSRTRSGQVVRA